MAKDKEQAQQSEGKPKEKNIQSRRSVLKILAGIPVLGVFAYELLEKRAYDQEKKDRLIKDMGLDNIEAPNKISGAANGDLLRIGIIGFGSRAAQLSRGLGFMHPADMESRRKSGRLEDWLEQQSLNVAITGICDVFEYPDRELTLMYSASLASSRQRGRVFMGHDASMELGGTLNITADRNSTRYKRKIDEGLIETNTPMLAVSPGSGEIDAVTSATEKYYASRGLTSTVVNGRRVDVTHLHLKEWIDCIRNGGEPSANIERSFEEGITILMAHRAYLEKRRVEWDPVNRRIV